MDGVKSILASKTFWGALIAALAGIAAMTGHVISTPDQAVLVDDVSGLMTVVGSFIAIWGRYTATTKIG